MKVSIVRRVEVIVIAESIVTVSTVSGLKRGIF
jgi:hypothetical protein